jgi:hypothetical protein
VHVPTGLWEQVPVAAVAAYGVSLLKHANSGDPNKRWWRLIIVVTSFALIWWLLTGGLAHVLSRPRPTPIAPSNQVISAPFISTLG